MRKYKIVLGADQRSVSAIQEGAPKDRVLAIEADFYQFDEKAFGVANFFVHETDQKEKPQPDRLVASIVGWEQILDVTDK